MIFVCANICPVQISAEEELLIAGGLDREPEALRRLADRYGRPVLGFLRAFSGGDEIWARRTVVQALSAPLLDLKPFQERIPFLVDVIGRLVPALESFTPRRKSESSTLPEEPVEPRAAIILEALSSLPWRERALLLLRDQIDSSLEEIAFALHLPHDSVQGNLSGVRIHFRRFLDQILGAAPAKKENDPSSAAPLKGN